MSTRTSDKVTATERKDLQKLLDDEFNILAQDLNAMAHEAKSLRADEIRSEQKGVIDAARKAEDKIRDMVRHLQDDGYEIKSTHSYDFEIHIKSTSVDKLIKEAEKEVDVELRAAQSIANRKLHQAKKDLMRATLSERAVELLEAMPKAADLMELARSEVKALAQ